MGLQNGLSDRHTTQTLCGSVACCSPRRGAIITAALSAILTMACASGGGRAPTALAEIKAWSAPPTQGTTTGECVLKVEDGGYKLSISATASCVTSPGLKVTVFDEEKHRLVNNEVHDGLVLQPDPPTTFWTNPFPRTSSSRISEVLVTASCAGATGGAPQVATSGKIFCTE